jgi:RNA polymerase sigma-70 factor (ECF subfamily)
MSARLLSETAGGLAGEGGVAADGSLAAPRPAPPPAPATRAPAPPAPPPQRRFADDVDLSPPPATATQKELVTYLYKKHHKRVFHLALRYGCGDRAFAEDVVQEVFVRLLLVWDRLKDTADLGGWLYRVTANRALNRLRNEKVRSFLRLTWMKNDDVYAGRQDQLVDAARKHSALMAALRTLPAKERVALCMHRFDGVSQEEIGTMLGHTKSAICKIIQRAEARLRAQGFEVEA